MQDAMGDFNDLVNAEIERVSKAAAVVKQKLDEWLDAAEKCTETNTANGTQLLNLTSTTMTPIQSTATPTTLKPIPISLNMTVNSNRG